MSEKSIDFMAHKRRSKNKEAAIENDQRIYRPLSEEEADSFGKELDNILKFNYEDWKTLLPKVSGNVAQGKGDDSNSGERFFMSNDGVPFMLAADKRSVFLMEGSSRSPVSGMLAKLNSFMPISRQRAEAIARDMVHDEDDDEE